MKRCVDSGLWVPGGGAKGEDGASGEAQEKEEEEEEEVYEEVDDKETNLDAVD